MTFAEACVAPIHPRLPLSATGFYATPKITWDRAKAKGRPFLYFSYGASCSEVTIDTMTGEMRVDRVDILHDVGKSLNPAIDLGQVEGAFVQGMGWLTTEELVFDDKAGCAPTRRRPTRSPAPPMCLRSSASLFTTPQGNKEDTIYRSKAVGEPPLMLGISVWTAIFNAVASVGSGTIIPRFDTPATPEAILHAIKSVRT
jgi:xanthine dehydrogenase large subunit